MSALSVIFARVNERLGRQVRLIGRRVRVEGHGVGSHLGGLGVVEARDHRPAVLGEQDRGWAQRPVDDLARLGMRQPGEHLPQDQQLPVTCERLDRLLPQVQPERMTGDVVVDGDEATVLRVGEEVLHPDDRGMRRKLAERLVGNPDLLLHFLPLRRRRIQVRLAHHEPHRAGALHRVGVLRAVLPHHVDPVGVDRLAQRVEHQPVAELQRPGRHLPDPLDFVDNRVVMTRDVGVNRERPSRHPSDVGQQRDQMLQVDRRGGIALRRVVIDEARIGCREHDDCVDVRPGKLPVRILEEAS